MYIVHFPFFCIQRSHIQWPNHQNIRDYEICATWNYRIRFQVVENVHLMRKVLSPVYIVYDQNRKNIFFKHSECRFGCYKYLVEFTFKKRIFIISIFSIFGELFLWNGQFLLLVVLSLIEYCFCNSPYPSIFILLHVFLDIFNGEGYFGVEGGGALNKFPRQIPLIVLAWFK